MKSEVCIKPLRSFKHLNVYNSDAVVITIAGIAMLGTFLSTRNSFGASPGTKLVDSLTKEARCPANDFSHFGCNQV